MRGRNGLAGEVLELRDQIDEAFLGLEASPYLALHFNSTIGPTVNDDSSHGFKVGSRWIKTSVPQAEFVCLAATVGAADWQETTTTVSGAVTSVFGRAGTVLPVAGDYPASKITNDSTVVGTFVSGALNTLGTAIVAVLYPLLVDRTVYCDSVSGNDSTGDGSVGLPWQTLARAWTDRLKYGELRAVYTIQLMGVGPYTMSAMGASVCGAGGFFVIKGDPAVDVLVAAGSFTGDLNTTTFTIATSAGLGSDTLKSYFLEITSGGCSGVRCSIVVNTDASISIPDKQWRTVLGAIVNGDTFRVFAPGTVINVPAPSTGQPQPGCYNWLGGSLGGNSSATFRLVRHIFYNLSFALTGQITFSDSVLCLAGVRTTGTQQIAFFNSKISMGFQFDPSLLLGGSPAINYKLLSYGLSVSAAAQVLLGQSSSVWGSYYYAGGLVVGFVSIGDEFLSWGGRHDGTITINGGRFEPWGGSVEYVHFTKTITVSQRGQMLLTYNGGKVVFAVTAGNCVSMTRGSFVSFGNFGTASISGGTTDVAGYAIQLSQGGGAVVVHGGALPIIGGTPGLDIKTSLLGAQSSAFLAAAGDFISDLGGAETVVRA